MKLKLFLIGSVLVLLIGIGILIYPIFANWYDGQHQGEVIKTYQEDIQNLDTTEINKAYEEAVEYNRNLHEIVLQTNPFTSDFNVQNLGYDQILNENADGVMAYIEIPSIDVYLPIYHGTAEDTLSRGVGHLLNTSLPVGGESTHCVISAHSGDPSAQFFTRLDELQVGDEFYLYSLGEKLTYRVDQIKTVLPYETDDFRIVDGADYVTLVTCTPYGINTHRLLVRGERIPTDPDSSETAAEIITTTAPFDYTPYLLIGTIVVVLLFSAASIRYLRSRHEKHID